MKKNIIRTVFLLALFSLIFLNVQTVLRYKWDGDDPGENFSGRNGAYRKEPGDSVDIFCVGTSEMHQAFSPVVAYEKTGLTGYNFAMQTRSAMSEYYEVKYALKYQKPSVVICDFMALFDDASVSMNDVNYRKTIDTIPSLPIKYMIARDICRMDPGESFADWFIPLLHYHSGWSELDETYFVTPKEKKREYKVYTKGWNYREPGRFDGEIIEISPGLWEVEDDPLPVSEGSVYYYDKLIRECREKDVRVAAVIPPKLGDAPVIQSHYGVFSRYFEDRGVELLDYDVYDEVEWMGLSMTSDFADRYHLNGLGAYKFTTALAEDLKELFGLEDRRLNPGAVSSEWDENEREYRSDLFSGQNTLFDFLEYLSLYDDMPFIMGASDLGTVRDERYGELFEALGIDVSRMSQTTPFVMRDEEGRISYFPAPSEDNPLESAYNSEVLHFVTSPDFDPDDIEKTGLQVMTFYPASAEVCSYSAYDKNLKNDDYYNEFEAVRKRLY
ncbi:MAG: hypothetical protein K5985_10670 [Lachnospiraceae bacterium]|nr:hypothetical protein [Lachnospiraceae bacterium]